MGFFVVVFVFWGGFFWAWAFELKKKTVKGTHKVGAGTVEDFLKYEITPHNFPQKQQGGKTS